MAEAKNLDEVIREIKIACIDGKGNFVIDVGTSIPYLRLVLRKERPPTAKMLEQVGYELVYQKIAS